MIPVSLFVFVLILAALAVWGAYSLGHSRGFSAGAESERHRPPNHETQIQALAVRLHNAQWPALAVKEFIDIGSRSGRDERARWLATARECQAAHETEGGAA